MMHFYVLLLAIDESYIRIFRSWLDRLPETKSLLYAKEPNVFAFHSSFFFFSPLAFAIEADQSQVA